MPVPTRPAMRTATLRMRHLDFQRSTRSHTLTEATASTSSDGPSTSVSRWNSAPVAWTDEWHTGGHKITDWAFGLVTRDREPLPGGVRPGPQHREHVRRPLRCGRPKLGDYAFNLAESADFMFDHAIFNDCMANVDFCEQMVKETNPTLLRKAESTPSPHGDIHGYKTIADIMRALNPFTGEFYLETLHVARYTREMYCLFGGRHTHPSTIMPGGCSADITHQTCTDYYVRLMRYFDYVKRSVPMHDDLYDFFLQELPGYDMVGYRDTDLVCWGCFDDPDYVDYSYRGMTEWGRHRFITPGLAFKGELITTEALAALREVAGYGGRIAYAEDPSLATFQVVA